VRTKAVRSGGKGRGFRIVHRVGAFRRAAEHSTERTANTTAIDRASDGRNQIATKANTPVASADSRMRRIAVDAVAPVRIGEARASGIASLPGALRLIPA
jgi:hypothetical protein